MKITIDFIFKIVKTRDIDLIGVALECSAIYKFVVNNGMDALCLSIIIDDYDMVKLLLDNAFDPNRLIANYICGNIMVGNRPLFFIYHSIINYDKIVKLLLQNGVNLNAPDYYCGVCKKDGIFCSNEFSHRCSHNVDNICRDAMIESLEQGNQYIIDCLINNGYNYKNNRLITYLRHKSCGIFVNNLNTMYHLYSIDEKYFYEVLSQDRFFATECKKSKNAIISFKGNDMTLEHFYKSQTKKYHEPIVVFLVAAYYYDENSLLSRDYLCLDMFRLIIKEYGEQLTDLSDP